ncbi:MAG: hypothetical protein M3Q42_00730 [Pseudomonadota bacterium]|nr:hypothetical protein [Pseudomonadota bacterium]
MADDAHTASAEIFSRDLDSFSDDVLVERLYDLAAQLIGGKDQVDHDELVRVDEVVYRRLEQAYSKDPHEPYRSYASQRLDS